MSDILVFGVRNLKIKPVATDPEGDNPMTYGAEIPIVGVQTVSCTFEQEQVEARGDDVLLGVVSNPANVSMEFSVAKLNMEAYSILMGGTFTCTAGSDKFELSGTEYGSYFGLECVGYTDDNLEFKVEVAKAKASQIGQNMGDKQFVHPTFSVKGVPPKGSGATATKMCTLTYTKS